MRNYLKTILPNFCKLKSKGMYAIHGGDFQGGMATYIEEESRGETIAFLFMPPVEVRYIAKSEVIESLKNKTFKLVEVLPDEVYAVIKANFLHESAKL